MSYIGRHARRRTRLHVLLSDGVVCARQPVQDLTEEDALVQNSLSSSGRSSGVRRATLPGPVPMNARLLAQLAGCALRHGFKVEGPAI